MNWNKISFEIKILNSFNFEINIKNSETFRFIKFQFNQDNINQFELCEFF
jgi:hypothetical protein